MATKEAKIGKFATAIAASDKTIKEARAAIVAKAGKRSAENKVRKIEDKVDGLETTIMNLTDLAPETTYSLRPGGKEFDADGWVDQLNEATLDLKLAKIELEVAQEILNEWF